MLSSDIAASVRQFANALAPESLLPGHLPALASSWDEAMADVTAALSRSNASEAWVEVNKSQQKLDNARQNIHVLAASDYADEVGRLRTAISDLEHGGGISPLRLNTYREVLKGFMDAYNSAVRSNFSRPTTFNFLAAANSLNQLVAADRETLTHLADQLHPRPKLAEDEDEISLRYELEQPTLENIAEKLRAIAGLYASIAEVLGVDQSPRVVKVETGSPLHVEISGWAAVLLVMSPLIREAAKAVWNRVLPEGQITAKIGMLIQTLKAQGTIVDMLKAKGKNVDALDRLHEGNAEQVANYLSSVVNHMTRPPAEKPNSRTPLQLPPAEQQKQLPAPNGDKPKSQP